MSRLSVIVTSALHGVGIGFALTMFEIALDQYPLRDWIARLSFTGTLILRSLVYVLVIVVVHLAIMHGRQRSASARGRVTTPCWTRSCFRPPRRSRSIS